MKGILHGTQKPTSFAYYILTSFVYKDVGNTLLEAL